MEKLKLDHLEDGFVIRVYTTNGPIELVTEHRSDAFDISTALWKSVDGIISIYKVHVFDSNSRMLREYI